MSSNPFDFNEARVTEPEFLGIGVSDWIPDHPPVPDGSVIFGECRIYRLPDDGGVEASTLYNDMGISELEFAEWLIRVGQSLATAAKRGGR